MSNKPIAAAAAHLADGFEIQSIESIALRIMSLRSRRVILDSDLAIMYDVPTKRFNEAVKRNLAKFPDDYFMFQLNNDEYAPHAFTGHGAIMAATVLSSPRAVQISVYIVRAFVQLQELSVSQQDFAKQLAELDDKTLGINLAHDSFSRNTRIQIKKLFDALSGLANKPQAKPETTEPPLPTTPKRPIGFITPVKSEP
jgi:ORF6N domain